MPLENDNRRWLSIKDGKIIEKLSVDQFKHFSHFTGHLMNITFKTHEKGRLILLHFIDEKDYFILSLFFNSPYASSFLKMVKNIYLHEKFTIIPQCKMAENKKQHSLFIKQNGENIKWYWNKENGYGDLPQGKEVSPGKWDYSDQLAYLELIIESDIVPALKNRKNPYPNHLVYQPQTGNHIHGNYFGPEDTTRLVKPVGSVEAADDLPF